MEVTADGYLDEQVFDYGAGPTISSDLQKDVVLVKAPAKNCTVKGYVRAESGVAITGATVTINWGDNQGHYLSLPDVTTDSSGYYSFQAMPGDYWLWFNADGYYGVYECSFSLYGGEKWVNQTLKAEPAADAHITGVITDEQQSYLSGVYVSAVGTSTDGFYSSGSATSDSSGRYDIALPGGTYNVTYSYIYTTGTHYYTVTKQISVASGSTHAEDVTMKAIPTYTLTLQVNDETGSPLSNVSVSWQISNDSAKFSDSGMTNKTGEITISACLGTGSASLSLNGYWDKTVNLDMNLMKGTTVTSTMSQINKDATISGTVTLDGLPLASQTVSFEITSSLGTYYDYATTDIDGYYTIMVATGTVNVTSYYYDQTTGQRVSFSDTLTVSTGDQMTEDIAFTLAPETIKIYGTVTEGTYTGAPSGLPDDLNGDGIPDADTGGSIPGTNDTSGNTTTPGEIIGEAVSTITAETGGTVEISGSISVEVPPGAINGTLNITVQEETATSPAGFTLLGHVYEIGPTGTQFSEPVNITLHYNPADVPAGVAENDIHIYWYNEQTNSWVDMGGTVDTTAHTVTIQVTHLSKYAMMVSSTDTGDNGETNDTLGMLGYIGPIPILVLVILLVIIVVAAAARGGKRKTPPPYGPQQRPPQGYGQQPPAYRAPPQYNQAPPPAQAPPSRPAPPPAYAPPQTYQQAPPPQPAQPAYQPPAPQPVQQTPPPAQAPAPAPAAPRPKPTSGRCSQCGSTNLTFNDDGSGRCNQCGHTFWWDKSRAPPSF